MVRKGDDAIVQVGLWKGACISVWSLSRNGWEETWARRRGGVRQVGRVRREEAGVELGDLVKICGGRHLLLAERIGEEEWGGARWV